MFNLWSGGGGQNFSAQTSRIGQNLSARNFSKMRQPHPPWPPVNYDRCEVYGRPVTGRELRNCQFEWRGEVFFFIKRVVFFLSKEDWSFSLLLRSDIKSSGKFAIFREVTLTAGGEGLKNWKFEIYPRNFVIPIERTRNFATTPHFATSNFCLLPPPP